MENKKEKVKCNEEYTIIQLVPLALKTYVQVDGVDENHKPTSFEEEVFALALAKLEVEYSDLKTPTITKCILPVINWDDGHIDIEPNFSGGLYHKSKEEIKRCKQIGGK